MKASNNETENVQQTGCLAGQVNNQALVDEIVSQIIEQRKAELQQKRQEAANEKQKERLDYTLQVIRDYGGSISRKQLTDILVKKFENRRQTISGFISQWIKDKSLFEMNAVISDSDKMYFGL